jgi:hypothetical protein
MRARIGRSIPGIPFKSNHKIITFLRNQPLSKVAHSTRFASTFSPLLRLVQPRSF